MSGPVWVSSTAATYYLGAIVDRLNATPEFIETNNTGVGNQLAVGNKPDFVVASVSTGSSVTAGGTLSFTAVLCNQGTATGTGAVDVYLSLDATINTADTRLGTLPPAPSLAPGACATLSGPMAVSAPATAYYAGAIADRTNAVSELIETNNWKAGNRVGVGNKPDLVVTQVTASPSTTPGGSVQVTAKLCNQGTASGSAPVQVYFSLDATVTTADLPGGPLPPSAPPLSPGACATLSGLAWVPGGPDAVYHVGVIADAANALSELIEDNNTTVGNRVGVGNKPDLVVTQVSSTPSAFSYGNVQVTATVCNQGMAAGFAVVQVYFSLDATITTSDLMSTSLPPGATLAPGACATLSGDAWIPGPDGVYYAGAIVDPFNGYPEADRGQQRRGREPGGGGGQAGPDHHAGELVAEHAVRRQRAGGGDGVQPGDEGRERAGARLLLHRRDHHHRRHPERAAAAGAAVAAGGLRDGERPRVGAGAGRGVLRRRGSRRWRCCPPSAPGGRSTSRRWRRCNRPRRTMAPTRCRRASCTPRPPAADPAAAAARSGSPPW